MTEPKKTLAPIPVPEWENADVVAMQALSAGTADEHQQKRALEWIVYKACATYDFCLTPEHDRLSAIFDGRRFAGLQIVKLLKLNLSKLERAKEKVAAEVKKNQSPLTRTKKDK